MIIQATPYGTKKEEPFAFTYSGDFTDSRVDGIGDVTLNTSGQLVTSGKTVTVSVYILAGGGGAAMYESSYGGTGGGGGNQEIEIELAPGDYEIIIGTGGTAVTGISTAGKGGNTTAFNETCTGGEGAKSHVFVSHNKGGAGGSPNGNDGAGEVSGTANGGSPNGGGIVNNAPQPGGNGLVRITFS